MYKIIEAETNHHVADAFSVRKHVFIEEQGVDPAIEHDGKDHLAIHIVGYLDQQPISCGRFIMHDKKAKLQRIAVLKPHRGKCYGKALVIHMEKMIKARGISMSYLHAQTHALAFYLDLGYVVTSDPFVEAGIEHVEMEKML